MVRVPELIVGILLLPWALWAFCYPRKDFALGKRIGFIGVNNREDLELNRIGVLRNRIGATIFILLAIFLIVDSILLLS